MEVSPSDKLSDIDCAKDPNSARGGSRDVYVMSGGRVLRRSDEFKSCGSLTGAKCRS